MERERCRGRLREKFPLFCSLRDRQSLREGVDEMERDEVELREEAVLEEEGGRSEGRTRPGSAFEGIYERLPDISVKSLDRFILLCVIALAAVVVIGVMRAHHMI